MRGVIASNAERLRELHDRMHEAFRKQPHGPEHRAACSQFRSEYDALAFPGGLETALRRLKEPDAEIVELTVQFLEVDPRFFRSGYIKETMLRRLKHCLLTDEQAARIGGLIVRGMDGGGRREFDGYSRLARIIHPASLIRAVHERLASSNPETVRRARAVQHVLDSNHVRQNGNE